MKLFFKLFPIVISLFFFAGLFQSISQKAYAQTGGYYCAVPEDCVNPFPNCLAHKCKCTTNSCPSGKVCSADKESCVTPTPTTPPAGSCTNVTAICPESSNPGTTWGVHIKYLVNGNVIPGGSGLTNTNGCFEIQNFRPENGDKIQWLTACVDPELPFVVGSDYQFATRACQKTGDPYNYYIMTPNVSCKSYDASSDSSCFGEKCGLIYGACGGPNDYPSAGSTGSNSDYAKNYGTVPYNSLCPIPNDNPGRKNQSDENKFRCVYAGYTNKDVDYVGCRNTSTYRYCGKNSNDQGAFKDSLNDSRCDGPAATNTPTPKTATNTPTPGPVCNAPDVPGGRGETAACQNENNAKITVSWSATTGETYDIRYRKTSHDTGWNDCTDTSICNRVDGVTSPYPITGLSFNTQYEWQILANKCNPNKDSGWSTSRTTTTPTSASCTPTNTPTIPPKPSCPTNVCVHTFPNNSGNNVMDVTWNSVSGATSYDVRKTRVSNGNSNVYTDKSSPFRITATDLANGVDYDIEARANNAGGNSGWCPVPAVRLNNSGDYNTCSQGDIDVHMLNDPSGDCSGTVGVGGGIVRLDSGANTTVPAAGYTYSNLSSGDHNVSFVSAPAGYTKSSCDTNNPKTRNIPPDATVNFWIQQNPPTCTSLTTSRATVNPGQNATLTCVGGPSSGVEYTWYTANPGSYAGATPYSTGTSNTTTWRSPNPYSINSCAYPTVRVCNSGGGSCNNYALSNGAPNPPCNPANQGINIVPLFSISGNVFLDINGTHLKAGQSNFSGSPSITTSAPGATVTPNSNGSYTITGISGSGPYTVSLSMPGGYDPTYPVGVPPTWSVTVGGGGSCSENSLDASCDANGNISELNFGITNTAPWIQSEGSDIWFNNGFTNPVPGSGATCGSAPARTILDGPAGVPGILFSGVGSIDTNGTPVSSKNWKVGGTGAQDQNTLPPPPPALKTSYEYTEGRLPNYSGAISDLPCSKVGNTYNCSFTTLSTGVYRVEGDVNLNSAINFADNTKVMFLIKGNLNINAEIHVPKTSYASFHVTGDINVNPNVGASSNQSRVANIEGWFSAGGSFNPGSGNKRLNIEGAVVTNSAGGGGTLNHQQRDLAGGNATCPSFFIKERPDFILNSPEFIQTTKRIWQEVAP